MNQDASQPCSSYEADNWAMGVTQVYVENGC